MHPIEAFVRNPVKVWVGVLMVLLFGLIAWFRMPMQLTPEVQIPTITIETRWPGASPQEIEKEIVQEQEEQLKGVEGITKMTSESTDSIGRVILEFTVGSNMQETLLRVNSRLQQVREYPVDADQPVITTSSSSDSPIAWFILSARVPDREAFEQFAVKHPNRRAQIDEILAIKNPGVAELRVRRLAKQFPDMQELLPPDINIPQWRKFTENVIEARFERVDGVSNANVIGGDEPELQVVVDPEQLAARQLTIQDVRVALQQQNADVSAGDIWEGKRRWVVRTLNQFRSPEQVENQLLAAPDGSPVYIRDVAEVRQAFKKPDGFVMRYGTKSIAVNVIRETGANVLDVMEGLRTATEQLNDGPLKDRGMYLTQVYDETEYIHDAINLVRENIFSGSALTMITLMVVLHLTRRTFAFAPWIAVTSLLSLYVSSWFFILTMLLIIVAGLWFARGAFVIGLTIPICLVGTFLVLDLIGMSLNVISLAGLAFAVGIVVDNATVVLENIYRHYQDGEEPFVAAEKATKEVWGAVVLSTLTNLAVFLPVLFIQDEAGQLFRDISLAISGAVGLSLFTSVTLIPTVAARLLRPHDAAAAGEQNGQAAGETRTSGVIRWIEAVSTRFTNFIVGVNAWIQQSTTRRIAIAGAMTGAAFLLTWAFWPKVEYLPNGNRNLVIGLIMPPPGYSVEEFERLGEIVEQHLRPYYEAVPGTPEAAKLKHPAVEDFFFVARGRQVIVGLRAADKTEAAKLIPLVFEMSPKMPGSVAVAFQTSLFSRGLQGGRTVDIEISGAELSQLVEYGGKIMGQVPGVLEGASLAAGNPMQTQMRPIPSLDLSSPEVHLRPNLVQAKELGVPANELGYTVNALVDGAYATDYYVGESTGSADSQADAAYAYIRGEKIDLNIVGSKESVQRTQDVGRLPVATPNGELVPLSTLADIQLSGGPEQVNRRERVRTITVQVTPPPAMALEDAIQRIDRQIVQPMRDSGQLEDDYTINMSGTADKLREAWTALRGNLILATIITYLLMAALFESWTHPLVIIMSVPLGAVGGILGLQLLNVYLVMLGEVPQALDVLTMLGFIILIGTVVNNPILIVHQALNHMREDGMDARAAVLESVGNRIRPIFITTLTTLIGLIPLVLFPGAGSELYRGLGAVVLGGIALSTAVTLVQIPSLFTLTIDLQDFLSRKLGRQSPNHPRAEDVRSYEVPAVAAENGNGNGHGAAALEKSQAGA